MRRTPQYISAVCQQHRISLDDGFEALLIFSQMTLLMTLYVGSE
jgi:hypothetical protein